MYNVLLVVHVMITVLLIVIILMQRSASDGMGLSGSSSSSFLSGRAAASAVTRATSILAALFILSSLALGVLATRSHSSEISIIDRLDGVASPTAPLKAGGVAPQPGEPASTAKQQPSVPRPQ